MTEPAARHLDDDELLHALGDSQRLGMLGRRPVAQVVEHSVAFVDALVATSGTVIDLGSGGGVPGLVIAWVRPDLRVLLVDRRARRTDHLRRLVTRLGLGEQVQVITADVSELPIASARTSAAVVARSFGPPVTTLRAAVGLVHLGGLIVVSEPPAPATDRWPPADLVEMGLVREQGSDRRVAVFRRAR